MGGVWDRCPSCKGALSLVEHGLFHAASESGLRSNDETRRSKLISYLRGLSYCGEWAISI